MPTPVTTPIKALVFDAYGTLYDVHSVVEACESRWPGHGMSLSQVWRCNQLEYTWLRSLMGRYADFETVTRQSLRYACRALELQLTPADEDMLIERYRRLTPFPEAAAALRALEPMPLAILSNGSPKMLDALVRSSGFDQSIGLVLSADAVRIFKPAPAVYRLATDALSLQTAEIGFVSSNCWDACGAKAFGFQVFWVNRSHAAPEELSITPDHVLDDLGQLATLVGAKDAKGAKP
jgi:2-haloacid dehalogenase